MKPCNVLIRKLFILLSLVPMAGAYAQSVDSLPSATYTMAVGPQYKKGSMHTLLLGKHYRKEWTLPVRFSIFSLDSAGLKPYEAGGGRQSHSLKLHDRNNREYVLRSIDKTFGKALPEIFQETFIETIINDQVSIAHPYSAITIAPLAEAAGIYHTWPRIVYVPQQPALDTFNQDFGNTLYLFEQRPDENWETASNFANSENIISTEKLLEHLLKHNSSQVDQQQFIRSRLFDMFIGDWGRHEDQWRWAEIDPQRDSVGPNHPGVKTLYEPIPRDRDQAYTKFDGVLLSLILNAAGIGHLQSFDNNIKNVNTFNYPARNLDRHLANKASEEIWINEAKSLQLALSDKVIENAVRQLPPEVFPVSGKEIISKLKSRRNKLVEYASDYYRFISKEVDVTGTKKNERFEIRQEPGGNISLKIYDDGEASQPYYSRLFSPSITNEIRVYGIDGKDVFDIGNINSIMRIRVIGGPGQDEYKVLKASAVHVYDSRDQRFDKNRSVKLHLSNDSSIHEFKYDDFTYSKSGWGPSLYYSREDRIYVGINYKILQNKWRRDPFANKHMFYVRYSVQQKSFHAGYDGIIHQLIGNWDLLLNAGYDWIRWTNFYGLGNETEIRSDNIDYHRIRSRQGTASIGFSHAVGKHGSIILTPFYETIKLVNDPERFLTKDFLYNNYNSSFTRKHFGGASLMYAYNLLDDALLPSKGLSAAASFKRVRNLNEPNSFTNLEGTIRLYIPLNKHFVLSVNNGAATVSGDPEFYQLNNIGGRLLRGFRRERFWGQTAYHNNNELQYLFNVKSWLYKGRMGIVGFADQGRVWLRGEKSDRWHYGYGAGIILAPFNKVYASLMYGMSNEAGVVHIDLRTSL